MKEGSYAAFNADGTLFDTPLRIPFDVHEARFYPDAQGFTMLEMPYKGRGLSMVVLVPQAADGPSALEKSLTAANLQTWIGKLQKRKTNVFLPRFKLETNYEMKGTLQALGMTRAFNRGEAEFEGMCASADPNLKLFIDTVIHKAFVEVNEKGTEAAAATVIGMMGGSARPKDKPFTPTFRADKPFVFLIRDKATGSILFLGA